MNRMNPSSMPQHRPKSASLAQDEIDRRPKIARADHVILERDPDTGDTTVTVDGERLAIPDFARVSCGLASDRPVATVTITIHARTVRINTKRLDIEGHDQ